MGFFSYFNINRTFMFPSMCPLPWLIPPQHQQASWKCFMEMFIQGVMKFGEEGWEWGLA